MIPAIVAVIVVVALCCAVAGVYSSLVTLHNGVDTAWRGVDAELQRRSDLILELIEAALACEGIARETIADVLAAHNAEVSAASAEERVAAAAALSTALERLFAEADAQPEVTANTTFCRRKAELKDRDDKLCQARWEYTERVLAYNNAIQTFPGNIFAGIFQFKERESKM